MWLALLIVSEGGVAHLVVAAGEVLGGDEGLKDLETWHCNSSHHCRARVGLRLAEQ